MKEQSVISPLRCPRAARPGPARARRTHVARASVPRSTLPPTAGAAPQYPPLDHHPTAAQDSWGQRAIAMPTLTFAPSKRPLRVRRRVHGGSPDLVGDAVRASSAREAVQVPERVILHPEQIAARTIVVEQNTEVRRIMLERVAYGRFLLDLGALPIHTDQCGALYHVELTGEEPLTLVHLTNATPEPDGTRRKRYVLRVPPTIHTARAAVAWTLGMSANTYLPAQETSPRCAGTDRRESRQAAHAALDHPLSREQDRRTSRIRAGRSRLQKGLRGRRLDDTGVLQGASIT